MLDRSITGGVPTIWMGVLQFLDAHPGEFDLSSIQAMYVGGSAVPQAMIEAFQRKYGLRIIQAWGMTEMSPLGTTGHLPSWLGDASDEGRYAFAPRQGGRAPVVEVAGRGE